MKRITLLMLMLAGFALHAQKQAKPNLNKALNLYREGKLAEAKEILDAATTYEKTMNDGKTWYYRGLVYAALDTTSNAQLKSLDPDPLKVAIESFAKADQMAGKSEYFITGKDGVLPITKTTQIQTLANYYLNKGAQLYQDEKLEEALANFEKTQAVYPQDTTAFFYGGFVANSLEQHDKAIANFEKYIELGGKSPDAYSLLININSGPKENKEKALEYVRKAKQVFPANSDFPKVEIGLLIDLNKVEEAKSGLENAVKSEPDNKIYHFYLGYVNSKLEKWDDAKKNFEAALKVDPAYFDAQYYLAQIYLIEADKVRSQLKNLGISAADKKKQAELDKELVNKFKVALPYWEKAEQLKGDDVDVLDRLKTIYYYLGDDKNQKRVEAKLKTLGAEGE
ncbi:tetratricopeptide repeat protein [Chryseosolibacter indicus]|uniref:Tetratricopeptide repeat protein n=1 Tax=Chryseosolibacter indicus TaxID=2782351 RepID=A0ABS5VLU9_9BACT|nr:tetratricopeptide repeat protein [Chryseosolibacter indicus]MBT1701752.1 tetratricopeptide repeat protein [Chryseosolibacter indicus]